MANISAIKLPDGITYTIVDNTSGWTDNEGTVTSVRVQASSPVQSSVSTEQNTSLNTTISLADGYGDTKNPYASKTKNYVLAAPSNTNGAPSFRALVAADIPDLSGTYLTSYTETDPIFLASAAHGITASDITNWNNKTSNTGTVKKVTAGVGLNTTSNDTATDGGDITDTGTLYLTKSGVTAGSYGDSGNQTPNYNNTFKVPYITVDKYGRVTAITEHTVKIPASDNTWRGIQNVLDSDSTTESLSAAQGKALATGSARDNTKLPLTGGTMTGQILINNVAGPKINSNNIDLKVWEVVGNSGSWNSEFGFHELYKGTGSGNDNTLELYAHNQAGTHVKVRTIKQDGTVTWHTVQTFTNTIQGSITGSAGSVAWSGVTSKPNLVNTITTTAGAHTAITSKTGDVSFNVPTTAAHVGIKFGFTTSGNNRAVLQDANGNLYVTQKDDNTWRGIQDNLNSTSATDSLSANQGKILNESKLSLTGGNVTGPVTFGDSVEIDEATIGDLIVNGNGNFTNNLQVNTINGVAVGSSPKFTDTLMTVTPSGNGNAVTSVSASGSVITVTKGATYSETDTKNTAGSNDTSSKIFLVGTTQQTTSSNALQTYSHDTVYVDTDGCLYSNNKKVLTDHQSLSGYVPTSRTIDGKALTGNIVLHTSKTATLSTTWSSKQQTVSVTGVTTSNTVIVSPAPASYNDYCGCGIYCSAQAADSLTFKCEDVPSAALTVNVLIIG